jgi:hypothetical protein
VSELSITLALALSCTTVLQWSGSQLLDLIHVNVCDAPSSAADDARNADGSSRAGVMLCDIGRLLLRR